jgi:hypothetical protein
MNITATQITAVLNASSATESAELFPDAIRAVFDRLVEISGNGQPNDRPSAENVEWAKRVLLRVLPRRYLAGAEIDAFQHEIHVNWEYGEKRVTVFLPAPKQLKIYCEHVRGDRIEHQLLPKANDPWEVSGVLGWMFE